MRVTIAPLLVALLVSGSAQRAFSASQADSPAPAVRGTWVGTLEVHGAGYEFAVTLEGPRDNVRGSVDIIASLSPDIELADIRVDGGEVSFSLPLSAGESLRFEGQVSKGLLAGDAVYSGDEEVRGSFSLRAVPSETLPVWARGGDTWSWPDSRRPHWPTEEWRTGGSTGDGLDTRALSAASEVIRERFPSVRALLIVRGGLLAYEEYFHGGSVGEPINIKSVSKGIITALVGVAIREGDLAALEQPVAALVPQYFGEGGDATKKEIRLHHLLDMTSGLHWVENGAPTRKWARRGHSSGYYLSLPLDCDPGECFNYSTASTHLLSEILTLQTGTTTRAFAERHLFAPIGLEISDWRQSASGVHIGGADILMTARDMARFGLLLVSRGVWDGREIIPREWVEECVAYHSEGQPFVGSYGYGWWRRSIDGHPAFIGKGYGGQFVVVVPDADLVVVVASDLSSPEMAPVVENWVCETVVPAAFTPAPMAGDMSRPASGLCSPTEINPGDPLTIRRPDRTLDELAVSDPLGRWFYLQGTGATRPILDKREFAEAEEITLNTSTTVGTLYEDGHGVQSVVFTMPGEYSVHLADDLETEPENSLHFECQVIVIEGRSQH